jgi:hypothetical protein
MLIIRGRCLVGHVSITVHDFPVVIALPGRSVFEPVKEILESLPTLLVSHQHF